MKVSKVSLFFFILIYNYISLRIILFPFLYNTYGSSGVLYTIFIFLGILCFFLFLPKQFLNIDFSLKYEKSKIKYFLNFLLLIRIILGISLGCYVLYKFFFYESSFSLVLIGFLGVMLLISSLKGNEIIQISTLFGIAILICYIMNIFNYVDSDFSLIYRGFKFNLNWEIFLIPYCFIFDNFFYFLVNKDGVRLDKKSIILSLCISGILFLSEYCILSLTSGGKMFLNDPFVGFIALSIEPVSRFYGNFDYIYILMIGVSCIFKFSFFYSHITNSFHIKRTKIFYAVSFCLFFILGMLCYSIYLNYLDKLFYYLFGIFLAGGIIGLWMVKEIFYARKIEKE